MMNKLFEKYAKVLLVNCLKIESNQPLFVSYNKEIKYFIDILVNKAKELNISDIYLDEVDPYLRRDLLASDKSIDELKSLPYWNRKIWNEYTKKDAAFLMLVSDNPGLLKDIDPARVLEMNLYSIETRKEYNHARDKSILSWCIAAVPSKLWSESVFPNEDNPVDKLWDKILDICLIKEDDPGILWEDKLSKIKERANYLNNYQFIKLRYSSSNGTNFEIGLPDNHIWQTAYEMINNKKEVLVNFPSEEVFTSPDKDTANGIVYNAKPLIYNDVVIDEFYIKFKDGKVVDYNAKKGKDMLKELINTCPNSDYLGEVALVSYDSPISNSNIIFKETLFDENASCHLALGDSFPECIKGGLELTKEELFELGLNNCRSHTDFMIGSKDLSIIGITKDNKEVIVFKDGNFYGC